MDLCDLFITEQCGLSFTHQAHACGFLHSLQSESLSTVQSFQSASTCVRFNRSPLIAPSTLSEMFPFVRQTNPFHFAARIIIRGPWTVTDLSCHLQAFVCEAPQCLFQTPSLHAQQILAYDANRITLPLTGFSVLQMSSSCATHSVDHLCIISVVDLI